MLECYFLRAACYHALGNHKNAVADYIRCLDFEGKLQKDEPSDRVQLVVLAFYQKELALYVYHKLDAPVASFCMDKDISPIFKVTNLLLCTIFTASTVNQSIYSSASVFESIRHHLFVGLGTLVQKIWANQEANCVLHNAKAFSIHTTSASCCP